MARWAFFNNKVEVKAILKEALLETEGMCITADLYRNTVNFDVQSSPAALSIAGDDDGRHTK